MPDRNIEDVKKVILLFQMSFYPPIGREESGEANVFLL